MSRVMYYHWNAEILKVLSCIFFLRVETLYEYDDTEYINLKNL